MVCVNGCRTNWICTSCLSIASTGHWIIWLIKQVNTLANCLGKLDEKLIQIYTAEIVEALEYIHSNNVMHRDIKPENIMINKDFHLKVVSARFLKV